MNIKGHIKKHKRVYIACGSCLVIGVILGRNDKGSMQSVRQIGFRNESNQMIINLVEKSTPSKPVHLVGTNLYFDSLHDAARKTGHSLSSISKNVNGHIANVHGDIFETLQPA